MKRLLVPIAALAALFIIGMPVARAASIEIAIDTVVRAAEGSVTVLATADTPPEFIGLSCVGTAEASNQSSVHPGNDLVVSSGGDSIVLEDVERVPGATTTAERQLTLGSSVTVSLRMGPDGVFSGKLVFSLGTCIPPTTTTTEPTTTSTQASLPAIIIEKTATPEDYGDDGIGHFTIRVTNPGPVDLTNIRVTDDVALAIDGASDCPAAGIPDLAVGEFHEYACSVGNLSGVSPFTNEATTIGTGPDGTEVTDTDDATVYPPVLSTTLTQPPTTTPEPTLPHTGIADGPLRNTSVAGFGFVLAGIALLGAAAMIGRLRADEMSNVPLAQGGTWFAFETRPRSNTIYIPLRPIGSDEETQIE